MAEANFGAQPQPTKQRLQQAEKNVKELEHEIKVVKQSQTMSKPVETVVQGAAEVTTEPTKSPQKILIILLAIGVGILILGTVILVLTTGALWWMLILLLILVVLMSDRLL